jgi:hypothetical protein
MRKSIIGRNGSLHQSCPPIVNLPLKISLLMTLKITHHLSNIESDKSIDWRILIREFVE